MDIIELSSQTIQHSEKYANVMSVCSTLLKYSPEAENTRKELLKRVPSFNVAGFNFGYFPDNANINLLTNKISIDVLQELGLVYQKFTCETGIKETVPHGVLSNHNIIMPYKNVYGDIIGLVGRTLLSKKEQEIQHISKYKNTSLPKGLNLFGMYDAKNNILAKDSVIVVEGQFDCVTCHRYGFRNVVALGGASFSKFHFYLLKRYTNNIYLLLDNDDAGQRERDKIISRFGKLANIQSIMLDCRYKDIDEYLTKSNDYSLLSV